MFKFDGKVIYIISPDYWGGMKVSKHHYAIELLKKKCIVFFIEPPKLSNTGISINKINEFENLFIVSHKPIYRGRRYLPSFIFDLLVKVQAKKIVNKIGLKPDVVWSFATNFPLNLQYFKAKYKVFFSADIVDSILIPAEVYFADLILAVSDKIYNNLESSKRNVKRINHGLQDFFVSQANVRIESPHTPIKNCVKVIGYSGNLSIDGLDRRSIIDVIENHPEIQFVFWGSYEKEISNLSGLYDDNFNHFITFLENKKNVLLQGVLESNRLNKEMESVDMFWLCLDLNKRDCSNSHKILEYLSFGKPIISNYVSSYKDLQLFYVLSNNGNVEFTRALEKINISEMRSRNISIRNKRIEFAIENSYRTNVIKIENMISQVDSFKYIK
jgi:hypothetical protein